MSEVRDVKHLSDFSNGGAIAFKKRHVKNHNRRPPKLKEKMHINKIHIELRGVCILLYWRYVFIST